MNAPSDTILESVIVKYSCLTAGDDKAGFESYAEVMEFASSDELFSKDGSIPELDPTFKDILTDMYPAYHSSKKRDTSLGGNNAINCYWSFNEDDDIIPPSLRIDSNRGMGRVYNEVFDEHQQIVYMTFGIPKFTGMKSFYSNLIDKAAADLHNKGKYGVIKTLAKAAGAAAVTIAFLPIIATIWLVNLIASDSLVPGKYYELRPMMPLYYRIVNSMIAHVATNIGLLDEENQSGDYVGNPEFIRRSDLDILNILSKKDVYDKLIDSETNLDDEFNRLSGNPDEESFFGGFFKRLGRGLTSGLTESKAYIGFRIEKSVDSSESASNETGESQLASFLNSKVDSAREASFSLGGLRESGAIGAAIGAVSDAIGGFINGALSKINLDGGAELLKGSGYIDLPHVWKNSSFSKDYSFNFQFRSPDGSKLAIFQSVYIPLLMLLAGAFPRAVGPNAYTSPFLVRMYCAGRVSIPLGIIDSISIKRGRPEFGWNASGLPTVVDVSITVKDLSPMMYVALGDKVNFRNIFGANSAFQEYLLTLSGVGLADRVLYWSRFRKKLNTALTLAVNNKLNPEMWGLKMTNTSIGRAITNLNPVSKLPNF